MDCSILIGCDQHNYFHLCFSFSSMAGLLTRMVAEANQLLLQDDVRGSKRQAVVPVKSEQCMHAVLGTIS